MTSRSPIFLLLVAGLAFALGGCDRQSEQEDPSGTTANSAVVTGTVSYRERIALAPDAVVHVRLDNVSHADRPAVTLAAQTIRPDGRQVPLPFALAYDPAAIDARARYVVRAEIRDADGTLLWTTDTAYPVITQGAPTEDVEVIVRRAPADTSLGAMPALPAARTLVYGCDAPDGEAFAFTVRTGPGEITIELPQRFGNRSLVLPQVPAASGSKFEAGGVLFWVSGAHVRFEVDGQAFGPCAQRPEDAVPEAAEARHVDFRAVGQEPGWLLEITEGQRIHFTYAYGEREVLMPAPDPATDYAAGRATYHAVTEAHDLRVVIEQAACKDVMSGEAYESTVTVTLDGETYRGCGRVLR